MNKQHYLEREYAEFIIKINKAGNDFSDAVNSLSPENFIKFQQDMLKILPIGFLELIKKLSK